MAVTTMIKLLLGILLLAPVAGAADLNGTWQFEQTGRNGQKRVTTYVFKVQGNKFTGLVAANDQRDILNGVIDGNTITFDTHFEFDDADRLNPFKGELNGGELKV